MAGLTVLVDHVASLRNNGRGADPSPAAAALLAELGGADGVGAGWHPGRALIDERDLRLLRQSVRGRMVLHLTAAPEWVGLALDIQPERVILRPSEMSDEGSAADAFDMALHTKTIFDMVDTLQSNGIGVGVAIVPEPEQVKSAHQARANWVHISTRRLQTASSAANQHQELLKIIDVVKMAHRLRLRIALGGGLDFRLVKLFTGLREIDEFSVGHGIIARAVLVGMETAVRDMVTLIRTL